MVSKNGQIVRGKAELAQYLSKMFGKAPSLKDLRTSVLLAAPVVRWDKALIAHGTSIDEYAFTDGIRFTITTIWSATLAEQQTGWKVAAIHFSFNLFDNPLLNGMRKATWIAGGLAGLFGAILGAILAKFLRARSPRPPESRVGPNRPSTVSKGDKNEE